MIKGENLLEEMENMELPEDIKNEIVLLYNLGVGIEDLKYFLAMRANRIM